MPFAQNGAARIFWCEDGDPRKPALLLLNLIGTDLHVWDPMLPYLVRDYRLLRMDARGHGASSAPGGEYGLDDLARDALAVLDAAEVGQTAVCGVSLGGMVAMNLTLIAPSRVSALIAACTSPGMDSAIWQARIEMVRSGGMAAVTELAMQRYFAAEFLQSDTEAVRKVRAMFLAVNPQGYIGCCAAIRDMALSDRLADIAAPTLVVSGNQDLATPFEGHGDKIAAHVPGAAHVALPGAHIPCVETPAAFAHAVDDFLAGIGRR